MNNKVLFEKPRLKMLNQLGYNCFDLHYHTKYSDGKNDVNIAIKKANRLGFGFAITDHNEIRGSIKAYRKKECLIIPAIEVTSRESYDILAYFYDMNDLIDFYVKYVKGKQKKIRVGYNTRRLKASFIQLLDSAKNYNCLLAPAHPFAYRPKTSFDILEEHPDILKKFHAIEVINGTMNQSQNINCFNWAQKLGKPMIGGSDAHVVGNLGTVVNAVKADTVEEVLTSILKKKHILVGKGPNLISWYYHSLGILRKSFKLY